MQRGIRAADSRSKPENTSEIPAMPDASVILDYSSYAKRTWIFVAYQVELRIGSDYRVFLQPREYRVTRVGRKIT